MRYFDTNTRAETSVQSASTIISTDERVSKFFQPLTKGEKIMFGEDGLPYFYTDSFLEPKVVDGVVVEGKPQQELLNIAKENKKVEINTAKKYRQLLPVTVRGVKFYGGRTAGQKYDEAFRLAKMMGLSEGNFKSVDSGMVVVDEAYANEIIIAVASATYSLWAKEQAYIAEVDIATTEEEVEAIIWED